MNNARKRIHIVHFLHRTTKQNCRRYPLIRLSGKYLKQHGFNIGDTIQVEVTLGVVVIKKV